MVVQKKNFPYKFKKNIFRLEVKLFCVANSTVVESLWELANCGFGYGHGITG